MKQAMIAGVSAAIAMTIIAGVAAGSYYVFVHKPEAERQAWREAEEQAEIEINQRMETMHQREKAKLEMQRQLLEDQLKLKEMLRD